MRTDASKAEDKVSKVLSSFSGGMRRNDDPSILGDNEYVGGINIRVRDGYIKPIKLPSDISSSLPAGKKQGVYGYDSILVVFNGGLAYGIDYSSVTPQFSLVNGFIMNDSVDFIYVQDVPASWMNIERKATDDSDINQPLAFFSQISGTPAALVCQDGINQPRLILSVGNARNAKTEGEWVNSEDPTRDSREYVPIGKQMMYANGILYILSADQKRIYRSVTGRPLDFVIAVDTEGGKLPPMSNGIEADRLHYALDYSPITAIYNLNSTPARDTDDAGFYIGSLKRSWMVFPNFAEPIVFNEPKFRNQPLFNTGPLNQFSVEEVLGETVIITESGPMTFNAILNTQTEGRNDPFYYRVAKLFEKITQTTTCIGKFEDYILFAVNTIYGHGVLVYDNLSKVFVGIDIYENISGVIKQFATVKIAGVRRLFFITTGDKLYEAFASSTTAQWQFYTKEMAAEDTEIELIPRRVRVTLANVTESGVLNIREIVDRKNGTDRPLSIEANTTPNLPPLSFPFGTNTADSVQNKTIPFEIPVKGQRVGLYLSGNFDCELQQIQFILEADEQAVTDSEQGSVFADVRGNL